MKTLKPYSSILVAVVVVSGFMLEGCAPPPPAELSSADETAIRESSDAWSEAATAGDWTGVAALYTEDAVVLPPNAPAVTGRANVEAEFEMIPEGTEITLEVEDIQGVADLAYVRGTYTMTVPAGDTTMTDTGKYIEIRRRQADGSWLISNDIYNSDVPLPEQEMGAEM